MSDLNVPEQLYQYMVGGHRRFQAGMHREKHKSPSYQIKVRGASSGSFKLEVWEVSPRLWRQVPFQVNLWEVFPVFSQEGDTINVDVTCPGATLALAMIYLKTNNRY